MEKKDIEIPFGAFDSELGGFEYTIPEGYKAEIKDGKVVVRKTESEDERIRKELIEYIKDQQYSFISAPDCRDKYEEEENDRYNSWIAWLEKQGEQKPANTPKFKIGDWVIDKQGIVHQIANVIEIVTCHTYGYDIVGGDYFNDNTEGVRLWTIQDAKDGDVIYSRHNTESFEWIGIFKSLDKENKRVFFYGFWHDMAKTFRVCGNEAYVLYDDFSPATKEKRDLLFQKMKEAGYEWDAEKKELKKIEPKPADLPNGEDYGIDGLYHAISILEKTLGKVDGYQSDDGILEHKCAITAVKKLYNQKPAEWSEDDETVLSNLIWALKEDMVLAGDRDEYVSWLQSLKDKTIPQPKQEWSEEDDSMVEDVRNSFEFHCDEMTEALQEQYNKFFDKVKSLRPQNRWKPSDEQIEALHDTIIYVKDSMFPSKNVLKKLYGQLKKLKEE